VEAAVARGIPAAATHEAEASTTVSAPATISPEELAGLEAEALYQMHNVGVCLREQADVTLSGGSLHVQAIVETDARKAEVLRALGRISTMPAVTVQISTLAEASQRQAALPPGPPRLARVERDTERIPVYEDLRSHFEQRLGTDTGVDEEVGRIARRVLSRSREALRHAWALKRHLNDFSHGEAGGSGAREKLSAMLRAHARVVQQETKILRIELLTVFSAAASDDDAGASEAGGFADRAGAIDRLLDLASSHEKAIRTAFALSAGGQPSQVKTDQFRRSLRQAEKLAARIHDWQ
jgi:hypothetical protein